MTVAKVQLSGSAQFGVEPEIIPGRLFAALPQEVCLGRKAPYQRPQNLYSLRLEHYFDEASASPPPETNYRAKAAPALARMYRNNVEGCCVISGKAHALGVWSTNDSDSAGMILATDQEIEQQYVGICGPGDQGCVITDVLNTFKQKGFIAGGKKYIIDAFMAADWTNKALVQVAQYLFGATTIGINLPQAWTQNAVWDVTNSPIVGGHDVTPIDTSKDGVYVSSWGRIYLITWAAFLSRKWLEEYWLMLSPNWYNSDKLAPCGIDAVTLKADLAKLNSGVLPDITPQPQPPTPIPQPPQPQPAFPSVAQWDAECSRLLGLYPNNHAVRVAVSLTKTLGEQDLTSPHTMGAIPWGTIVKDLQKYGPEVIAILQQIFGT